MKLSKKQKIIIWVVVAVAAFLLILIEYFYVRSVYLSKVYSVVHFANGEVYVGHLSTFPRLKMKDVYLLQVIKNPTDSAPDNFQLIPIRDAVWSPQKLYLEREQILFYGPLNGNSKIVDTLSGAR